MGVRKTETCVVVWSVPAMSDSSANDESKQSPSTPVEKVVTEAFPIFDADSFYDAGDQGCGDGPLGKIAALMRKLDSGQTLEVRATDPTVAIDLPAWCRMTGHTILKQEKDRYLIQKG